MVFPPAEQGQYDVWNNFNNNDPNWTLLPYFKRSERFIPPNHEQLANGVRYLSEVHGTFDKERDGGVKVGYPRYPIYFFPQSTMWREAASSFRPSPDLAKGDPQGTLSLRTRLRPRILHGLPKCISIPASRYIETSDEGIDFMALTISGL